MRNVRLIVMVGLVLSLMALSAVAEDAPWFDMEHCGMCKPLMDQPGLLEHTTWENYPIANGVVSITTVAPEFMPQYEKARAAMDEVGKKMQAGEQIPMCPMCQAMGACFAKGLKSEMVQTKHGDIHIMTASDAAVVAEIQAWAKRTTEEMAKMEAAEKAKMEQK